MSFDPYYKWLGIPPDEQPPNHYRLLGVRDFEADAEVIENAADQRMSPRPHVSVGQVCGAFAEVAQRACRRAGGVAVRLPSARLTTQQLKVKLRPKVDPQQLQPLTAPSQPPLASPQSHDQGYGIQPMDDWAHGPFAWQCRAPARLFNFPTTPTARLADPRLPSVAGRLCDLDLVVFLHRPIG